MQYSSDEEEEEEAHRGRDMPLPGGGYQARDAGSAGAGAQGDCAGTPHGVRTSGTP